ncbi:DNA polymerase [Duganella sp. SG902]|uniref:uracil-DNA glycosylase n=1 Tax=Duganella sp. SG902 TaxID=2587016 RepID=UPI00159E9318|nr:uracil-DNA glycosylase [Duganella sp. SG902]NVM77352.1 DNA polymerase [Duganella sp. SG902]
MSQLSRNKVFLQEMGIGVQWKLRHGAEEGDAFVTAVQALADGLPEQAPPPVPQPAAPVPMPAPAAPADDDATAWFDDAPAPAPAPAPVAARPAAIATRPAPATSARQPAEAPAAAPDEESTAWFDDAPAAPPVAATPPTAPAPAEPLSDTAIAAMDWTALQAAVASCTRCALCQTRRNAVNGRGAQSARWIAISGLPSRADDEAGEVVTGEAGQLLNNMLKAIELQPESDVYVTNVVKCRPSTPDGADRMPTADEVIACRPFLDRELALSGATMAITFGQFAARGLMMGPAARGKVMRYGAAELPVVATYHPDDLLRKPEDKAKAWADLCLAKASHA